MKAEYWKLSEILRAQVETEESELVYCMTKKIEDIEFFYSRPLSEKQLEFIKKDDRLLKAVEVFATLLGNQIEFLLNERESLHLELVAQLSRNSKLHDDYLRLYEEFAKCKTQYDPF